MRLEISTPQPPAECKVEAPGCGVEESKEEQAEEVSYEEQEVLYGQQEEESYERASYHQNTPQSFVSALEQGDYNYEEMDKLRGGKIFAFDGFGWINDEDSNFIDPDL